MHLLHAPLPQENIPSPILFLAGSIELGAARPWQKEVEATLHDLPGTILNPRRTHWSDSWEGEHLSQNFRTQVNWELDGISRADLVFFFFDPDTKSPISLLELGLCKDRPALVCCPEGFWRRGNIMMICERFHIPLYENIKDALAAARERLSSLSTEHVS